LLDQFPFLLADGIAGRAEAHAIGWKLRLRPQIVRHREHAAAVLDENPEGVATLQANKVALLAVRLVRVSLQAGSAVTLSHKYGAHVQISNFEADQMVSSYFESTSSTHQFRDSNEGNRVPPCDIPGMRVAPTSAICVVSPVRER